MFGIFEEYNVVGCTYKFVLNKTEIKLKLKLH